MVDGSWAAAHLGAGRFDRYLLFGATAIQWPAWVAGTALGVVVSPGPDLLHRLGLDVLTPALFLALLCDEVRRERINRLPALLGAAIAAGLIVFLPAGPALVGAALAALVALLRTPARHRRADETGEKAEAETTEAAGPAVQHESGLRSAHSGEEVAPVTLWLTIAAVAALSFACKAFGPALLGGRTLPPRAQSVIALSAPALLAGFIVAAVLGPGWTTVDLTMIAGLAALPLLLWRRAPLPVALVAAVAVAAALRMWV
ncbi:AzlD domain-containing protein [Streptomyces sp. f150]|uniref:AzlD domain-containing protein n=1 Tax=Streptomyces sp. f150 TaxID=1827699 RepID=UPI001C54FD3A|nr:AzlD domain-containing protein [Streptomyces sp. f150]